MIGKDKVFIIAEAGVNHNGSLRLALKLVDAASAAGVDAVKFQTWKTENVVTRDSRKAPYQLATTDSRESQFDMLKRLELAYDDFQIIKAHCDQKNIMFLSTADEIESATFLCPLQPVFKIGSAELTDLPFLSKIARFKKPVILSTGMGNLKEIKNAVGTLMRAGLRKKQITLLHCNSVYPAPFEDVNLRAMLTIKKMFGVNIGISDHTLGVEVAVAAVALGARVVEKHFTLDRRMEGPDHKSSLAPEELKAMVTAIRHVEDALGTGIKKPSLREEKNIPWIRKSIVAKTRIEKGEIFSEENLTVKRPASGVSPAQWNAVIGRRAKRVFKADEMIEL